MGDVVETDADNVTVCVNALSPAPIERIDFFNGRDLIDVWYPFGEQDVGRRIKLIWEGAEYRGRGRETLWAGSAVLSDTSFTNVMAINFWNKERPLRQETSQKCSWQSVTTGGIAGIDAGLKDGDKGTITIDTPLVKETVDLSSIDRQGIQFYAGGLGRKVSLYRLPEQNGAFSAECSVTASVAEGQDNPLFVRITNEDGHRAWSSPIYVVRK
jgi:hypothetical protein